MKAKSWAGYALASIVIISCALFLFSEEKDTVIARNYKKPVYGDLNLRLKNDIVIGNESDPNYVFGSINGIEVTDKYIFILDSKFTRLQIYDIRGKFIKSIGNKGEGPGEFMIPNSFCISKNGHIYVHDVMRRRITVYNEEWNYKRDIILSKMLVGDFFVDDNEFIYSTLVDFEPEGGLFTYLAKMNPEGEIQKILRKIYYLSAVIDGKRRFIYEHPYLCRIYFTLVGGKELVLVDSLSYGLIVINLEGKDLFKTIKEEKPEGITNEEKSKVFSMYLKEIPKNLHGNVTFPDRRPYSSGLIKDEMGRIYVENFKPISETGSIYNYDVFNKNGEYLYRLKLMFRMRAIGSGHVYTTLMNDESGENQIIRYKIENWGEIKY